MPTIKVQAQLSPEDLQEAVEQLQPSELEKFVQWVLSFRAKQYAPSLSKRESELFKIVNQSLPEEDREQYRELVKKRQDETLTEEEYPVLIDLSDRVELIHGERMQALFELSQIRQTSLESLMDELGIPAHRKSSSAL